MIRQPCRAGSFYEAGERACRDAADRIVESAVVPDGLPGFFHGGLVPHAGWVFSGRTAAMTLKALAGCDRLDRVVIFGADHWGLADGAAVYEEGSWASPLGEVAIDEELACALLDKCPALRADGPAHAREHSIEVQLPLMQVLRPDVMIVPVNISPAPGAIDIGRRIGEVLKSDFPGASVLGSTDLTHYGPQYGFTPGGGGNDGLDWAGKNDRRILGLIEAMRPDAVIDEACAHQNACGAGAVAAAIAACRAMGARSGLCLEYTSSAEIMLRTYHQPSEDAVGYASVVFA